MVLSYNNIGIFNADDELIYSCLSVYTEGALAYVNGISSFDVAFNIVSGTEGIIAIEKTRPFNVEFAQMENGEDPSCSGVFETETSLCKDVIQIRDQVLSVEFELYDGENLELILRNAVEM